MATWKGKVRVFRQEVYRKEDYGYGSYEDVEWGWNYNTTSDTFRPYTKLKDEEPEWGDILGKDQAEAMLCCLAEWYNNYEGSENLDELIKQIRKENE